MSLGTFQMGWASIHRACMGRARAQHLPLPAVVCGNHQRVVCPRHRSEALHQGTPPHHMPYK